MSQSSTLGNVENRVFTNVRTTMEAVLTLGIEVSNTNVFYSSPNDATPSEGKLLVIDFEDVD